MEQAVYIGVDIGGTSLRAASFLGHDHTARTKAKTPTQAARGFDIVIQRLEAVIRQAAPPDMQGVAAVGIAAPGPTDPRAGVVYTAANLPHWENVPLKRLMEERLQRPVFIGNDANLAALGEWRFGAGRGHDDVLYLTISTGIGGGVISGGRLLLGARGLAAEVGHTLAVPNGPLCGCGQRGHLESVASGTAIGRTARERLKAGEARDSRLREMAGGDLEQVNSAMVGKIAQAGDPFAIGLIADAGRLIGLSLASFMHLYNPSIVVVGGGVSLLGDLLLDPVRAAVRESAMSDSYWRDCPIVPAQLGDDAGLIGAGALAMGEAGQVP